MTEMDNTYIYRAFGLTIESEFFIVQVPLALCSVPPDVTIKKSDLSWLSIMPDDGFLVADQEISFAVEDLAKFRIRNGSCIEVDLYPVCKESLLSVFLMGSCMGAVLHQRNLFLLHGSCVTNGRYAVLITGDSGAGKSTLASEFLVHGWKLLTDDVAVLDDVETIPEVQSSYPSQKLWQDALEHYNRKKEEIHSLYFDGPREKFGINVSSSFADGKYPLKGIIRLYPVDYPCHIQAIEGMARVDQLLRNTYRMYMITPDRYQEHFRRCVALSDKVQMAFALREKGKSCAAELYEMIIRYLGDKEYD